MWPLLTIRYQQAFSDVLPCESEDEDSAAASVACKPVKYERCAVVIIAVFNSWSFSLIAFQLSSSNRSSGLCFSIFPWCEFFCVLFLLGYNFCDSILDDIGFFILTSLGLFALSYFIFQLIDKNILKLKYFTSCKTAARNYTFVCRWMPSLVWDEGHYCIFTIAVV